MTIILIQIVKIMTMIFWENAAICWIFFELMANTKNFWQHQFFLISYAECKWGGVGGGKGGCECIYGKLQIFVKELSCWKRVMASPTQSITARGNKHNACGVTKPSCCNGFTMTSSSSIMTMFTETWPREESINTTSSCPTSWLLNTNAAFLKGTLMQIWKSPHIFKFV